jgi:putative ABC transport system permease protein
MSLWSRLANAFQPNRLNEEISSARSDFHAVRIRTQSEINRSHTVRERLLSMLASFFAGVALLLASIGLYGVFHYSVLQRRKEIGIRIAVGAPGSSIVRLVTQESFFMVLVGTCAGVALGMFSTRYIESLLYQVKPTDLPVLALPSFTILVAALGASLPAVLQAIRTDPIKILREE